MNAKQAGCFRLAWALILWFALVVSGQHVTAQTYLITIDDLFSGKATTSVGSGASSVGANGSTGIGIPSMVNGSNGGTSAGWIDYTGNYWQIYTSPLTGAFNGHTNTAPSALTSLPAGFLYRPSAENFQDGYVRLWPGNYGSINQNACAVTRFTTGSGGSAYIGLLYTPSAGTLFIGKLVNGTATWIASGVTMTGTPPTGSQPIVFEMDTIQTNSTTTTITCKVYLQSDTTFSSPILTYSTTDTTGNLQNVTGSYGIGSYNSSYYTRAQLAKYNASSALTSGTLSADTPSAGKTLANLIGSAATGGTAPISYQLHRSTTNGFTPTWGDATTVASPGSGSLATLQNGSLSPSTTYYYVLMAQDSEATPVTVSSNQVTITTLASNAVILGFVGDSLTYGLHSSATAPAAGYIDTGYSPAAEFCFFANANQDLNNYIGYNMGVSGSTSGQWVSGQANYTAAATVFAKAQCTDIFIMLGTNDARTAVPAATYGANIASIASSLLTISGVQRVHLNFSTYDRSSGGDESLLITYKPQLQSIANGGTLIMGDTAAHQAIYDYSINGYNVYYTGDYIHLIDPGYAMLGYLWWKAYSGLGNSSKDRGRGLN